MTEGIEVEGKVTVVTGTEKVARVTSGLCWTGDDAVCAWICFSLFRHFALLFWNHTWVMTKQVEGVKSRQVSTHLYPCLGEVNSLGQIFPGKDVRIVCFLKHFL